MGKYGAYVWSSFGLTLIVSSSAMFRRARGIETVKDITARMRAWRQNNETKTTTNARSRSGCGRRRDRTALTLQAFQENMMFFVEISDVAKASAGRPEFPGRRAGGRGQRQTRSRRTRSRVRPDRPRRTSCTVSTAACCPTFSVKARASSRMAARRRGQVRRRYVLAKHDENYMPPEVADSLAKHAAEKAAQVSGTEQ